jgi:hypothetical protein
VGRCHVEAFKRWLAERPAHHGGRLHRHTVRRRLNSVQLCFQRLIEWGAADAPARAPIFPSDLPIRDDPLPRFLDDAAAARLLRARRSSDIRRSPDRGGPSQFPPSPSERSEPHTPGSPSRLPIGGSSPLPWPSPEISRAPCLEVGVYAFGCYGAGLHRPQIELLARGRDLTRLSPWSSPPCCPRAASPPSATTSRSRTCPATGTCGRCAWTTSAPPGRRSPCPHPEGRAHNDAAGFALRYGPLSCSPSQGS